MHTKNYEVIIIGGSYSGLSAAMALGRSLRIVLIIDAGNPCNKQTPHSHNFLTQDGKTPAEIASEARRQVKLYDTVTFHSDFATRVSKIETGFEITTGKGQVFTSKKLILATGIKDIMPEVPGFAECWGISVIHCPYCHGYEVRNEKTGVFANGDYAFEYAKMITNWTKDLTLFTNGKSTLAPDQTEKLVSAGVQVIETELEKIIHTDGKIDRIVLKDNSEISLNALYAKADFVQNSEIPSDLGIEMTDHGHLKVDTMQKTNIPGVYACGDNTSPFRSVSFAVSSGTMAGAACNKELIDESF